MKKHILYRLFAVLLVLIMLPVGVFAADVTYEDAWRITGDWLEGQPHTVGSEWFVIGLKRSERSVSADYADLLKGYIRETADENHRLHKNKSTETSRTILALTAIGLDPTNVEGHDLIAGISSLDHVKKQGLNGVVWALIALDSGNYAPNGDVTRRALIDILLKAECPDGGWTFAGSYADPDMTGMTIQALAPYYSQLEAVKEAVDRAVDELSKMQKDDGGFATVGVATSESSAQVLAALSAMGIDGHTDERFIKNGHSVVDSLLSYFVEDGGFRHVAEDTESNGTATGQGYYALTAYARFLEGKSSLFVMGETPVLDTVPEPPPVTEPEVPQVTEPPTETPPPVTEPSAAAGPTQSEPEEPMPSDTETPAVSEQPEPAPAEPPAAEIPAPPPVTEPVENQQTPVISEESEDTVASASGIAAVGGIAVVVAAAVLLSIKRKRSS